MKASKVSKLETTKENSKYLRGTIEESLGQDTSSFSGDDSQLLKFHGCYQQDDRDLRQQLGREGKEKAFSLMVRTKTPGGKMSADQYLNYDQLCDEFGNGTLRITSRQAFQFHGVLKKNLKATIAKINQALGSTQGACGDVVRNVMADPAPFKTGYAVEIQRIAKEVSDQFLTKSNSYHEIWLDGEKVSSESEDEPIYGKVYLPRKFKIAITSAENNAVDAYTQDLGIIPEVKDDKIAGFNILVGGGLGMTHNIKTTYPRLGTPFCFVTEEELPEICKAIVLVQRDNGNRVDRKNARMKYLIDSKGLDWFRSEVEARFGKATQPPHEIQLKEANPNLGWNDQGDGKFFLGLSVENGRIKDEGDFRLKTALKAVVEKYQPVIYLTPFQDILLGDINEADQSDVESIFTKHGVKLPKDLSLVRQSSIACPALPTCGLAISESERALPAVIDEMDQVIQSLGFADQQIIIRMTGCPNGCARPYNAEIAFVGKTSGTYNIYVGGSLVGDRLAFLLVEAVKQDELVKILTPVFEDYKKNRQLNEDFGDYCHRLGQEDLQKMVAS